MKTFEERYTAWIDGELEGSAMVAFEQELARRVAVGEAYADKAEAMRLSSFLHDHLHAPALTNGDFFNHQLRERIAGERAATHRPRSARPVPMRAPLFAWSLPRLAWLGTACLFISGALYYGMIPRQQELIAANKQNPVVAPPLVEVAPAPALVAVAPTPAGKGPVEVVSLTREQQERLQRDRDLAEQQDKHRRGHEMVEPGGDIQARVPDQNTPTTATPLHYKDSNVNVLWVNGLEHLPDAAIDNAAPVVPANPAVPAATP